MSIEDLLPGQEGLKDRHIFGVVIAVVTSNQDPEGLGRIKINFPWRGEKDESYWARIASPMAGNERGMVFYPEVDDEVLVAFEHGEINQPYVIGALWNGKDKPPETNSDGKNNIRKIKSRSGHEIIFNDDSTTKKEKIEIVDKTGSNKIKIDSMENSIDIESAMKLKIKSNNVEIEGTASLTLKSSSVLTIQGSIVKIN